MHEKELADVHGRNLDLVNVLEAVLASLALVLALDSQNLLLLGALEENVVLRVQFQIVARAHRVQHVDLVLVVLELLAFDVAVQGQDIDARLGEEDVVLGGGVHERHDLALPEAEGLVDRENLPVSAVNDEDPERVDQNALVRHDEQLLLVAV